MAVVILLLLVVVISFSSSTSFSSPLNIETFYPFPLIPSPSPSPSPAPPTFIIPPPPSSSTPPPFSTLPKHNSTSNTSTIVKAVSATVAATLLLSVLLFFLFCLARRRKKHTPQTQVAAAAVGDGDELARFNGNVKGLIVDENGLDVLYLKKLHVHDFEQSIFQASKHVQQQQQQQQGQISQHKKKAQEISLFRGKSSTSYNKVAPESDEIQPITSPPPQPPAPAIETEIPKKQGPVPPPPPPPKTVVSSKPPPPPPLPKAVGSSNPPPPPPPKAAVSSKPLPPPPRVRRASSQSEGKVAANGNGQVKLKPLHWDKLKPNGDHSMVWDKMDNGSFRFDGDLMEALFGYVATNRKSPPPGHAHEDDTSLKPTIPKSSQLFVLDPRKSQNTAIIIKSLSISRNQLLDVLHEGHSLDLETLEKLTRIAPTEEEQSKILDFNGDVMRLADAESFLYHLLKSVPSAFARFDTMLFRSNYGSEISQHRDSLQTFEAACKELRSQRVFMKLLEAILKAGNRMNAGTARGNAQAFKLTSLQKLSDVKSIDGKTTLLHFVVEQVVRSEGKRCATNRHRSLSRSTSSNSNSSTLSESSKSKDEREKEYIMLGLPVVGGLSAEFSNVKKAAFIDYDNFAGTCTALTARLAQVNQLVEQCDGGFLREIKRFLEAAEDELKEVSEEQIRVMKLVSTTTEYYQAGSSKDTKGVHPVQLFGIIKDFLSMVDNECVEITRNMQRKKTTIPQSGSSSSKSPTPRTPTRFHNLPERFMISKSSSSDSDTDT